LESKESKPVYGAVPAFTWRDWSSHSNPELPEYEPLDRDNRYFHYSA